MTDENCRMSHRHGKAWLHGSMRFIDENECKPGPVIRRFIGKPLTQGQEFVCYVLIALALIPLSAWLAADRCRRDGGVVTDYWRFECKAVETAKGE